MRLRLTTFLTVSLLAAGSMTMALTSSTTTKPTKPGVGLDKPGAEGAVIGKQTWALLVGVSHYQSNMITSLKYPADDVKAIADALEDPTVGHVPASHIKVLTNEDATSDNIKGAVDTFLKPNVQKGDSVLIFLAGHGVAKGVGAAARGYLLSYDVKGLSTSALDESAVNLKQFAASVAQLPAAQYVAFIDACREDPTPGRGVAGNPLTDVMQNSMAIVPADDHPASSATLFACSLGQRAYEDDSFQHGVFTHYILDGLKTAADVPDSKGMIDMGILAQHVKDGVTGWSQKQSASGDFDIEQTPDFEPSVTQQKITLMDVDRAGSPLQPPDPKLTINTYPQGADVTVDDKDVGAGTVVAPLDGAGSYTIKVTAPGYDPVEETVKTFQGYPENLTVNLGSRGLSAANDPSTAVPVMYTKGLDAESHQEWDVAEQGYTLAIQANAQYEPSYEHLAGLYRNDERIGEYLGVVVDMNGQTTQSAHTLSLLSAAYAQYCTQGPAKSGDDHGGDKNAKDFPFPKSQQDAGGLAVKAANAAIKMDGSSAEAERSLGFALTASDQNGKNKKAAIAAFGNAVLMSGNDAANQYGMGYGLTTFAQQDKNPDDESSDLQRAVPYLQSAITLRPDYFEAHLELAYCYHLLKDRKNAEKEYTMANSTRGQATDTDAVVSCNIALSALAKEDAQDAPPDKKADYQAASDGYMADAKEENPNLQKALGYLRQVGVSTQIEDYLPDNVRSMMDVQDTVKNQINNSISSHLPSFHF